MLPDFLQQLLRGEFGDKGSGSGLSEFLRNLFGKEEGGSVDKPTTGLGSLIQAILGEGEAADLGGQPDLAPFTEALAERMGISTRLASIIVTFAAGLLLAVLRRPGSGAATEKPVDQPAAEGTSAQPVEAAPAGLNLDYLLDEAELVRSGAAARLAKRTGLDEAFAARSLRMALALLLGRGTPEGHAKTGRTRKRKGASAALDLKSLLDDWR